MFRSIIPIVIEKVAYTLKMEAARFLETLVSTLNITQCHDLGDHNINPLFRSVTHRCILYLIWQIMVSIHGEFFLVKQFWLESNSRAVRRRRFCLLPAYLLVLAEIFFKPEDGGETSVASQQTTRHHNPEDDNLHNHRCENLKSYRITTKSQSSARM
jgi:hypothetical protein